MKIYVYQYELPFSRQHYNIAQHYVVGQSEKAVNTENPTITVLQDELIETVLDGFPSLDVNSHKVIHIDRIVPKAVKGLIPKSVEQLDEQSHTRGFDVVTTQQCTTNPADFKLTIHTNTFREKLEKLDTEIFTELKELGKDEVVKIVNLDYHKELDQMIKKGEIQCTNYSLDGDKCYCIKLVYITTTIFGKSIIESGVGGKMKSVYYNNFHNVIKCYNDWKDLKPENIREIRQGKGVKEAEKLVEDE